MSRTNVYIGGLPKSFGDMDLYNLFAPFGEIVSAKVMLHIHTGVSRGIGFVQFKSEESAIASIMKINGTQMEDRRIAVRLADARAAFNPGAPTEKIFVRNIPLAVKPKDVVQYFEDCGTVVECTMHLDTAGFKAGGEGARCRIAYITFTTTEEAERAAKKAHGQRPFPSSTAALMAKVAETDSKRAERRQKKLEDEYSSLSSVNRSTHSGISGSSVGSMQELSGTEHYVPPTLRLSPMPSTPPIQSQMQSATGFQQPQPQVLYFVQPHNFVTQQQVSQSPIRLQPANPPNVQMAVLQPSQFHLQLIPQQPMQSYVSALPNQGQWPNVGPFQPVNRGPS